MGLYALLRWSSYLPELETDGPYIDKDSDQPTGGGCIFDPGEWTSVHLMSPLPFKPHPSQICSSNGSNGLFLNREFLKSIVLYAAETPHGRWQEGRWRHILGSELSEAKITWPLPRNTLAALLLASPNKIFAQITSIMVIWFKMLTYSN